MKNIKFKLEDIKLLRSEVRDHPIVFSENFNLEDVQIEVDFKFNSYDNYLQNFMHFKFSLADSGKDITLGHFDIIYTFEVDSLEDILKEKESKEILHLNIISLAYSTSRGILFCETKGYAIHEIYLGPISARKFYESHMNELTKEKDISITLDN